MHQNSDAQATKAGLMRGKSGGSPKKKIIILKKKKKAAGEVVLSAYGASGLRGRAASR